MQEDDESSSDVVRRTRDLVIGKLSLRSATKLSERLEAVVHDQIAAKLNARPHRQFIWQTPADLDVPKR